MRVKLSRRGRWAVPAAGVVVTGAVIAASQITIAQASPALPARTPAQLLAQIDTSAKLPPLTGTIVETTSLGLPALPGESNPTSLASLLTGSHTMNVYYDSPQHFRLQVPQSLSESDLIRDGNTLWEWDSTRNAVTEYTWSKGALNDRGKHVKSTMPTAPVRTPQQAANELLKAVGKTTVVSVQTNVLVAGEPAYQLVLAPKDQRSLIGQVVIAIDGKYGVPLRVQVFARNSTTPAFQVGYTQLAFVTPAPANLQFTPPPGATLRKVNLSGGGDSSSRQGTSNDTTGFGVYGSGWLTVAELPQQDLTSLGTGAGSSSQSASSATGPGVLGGDSQAAINALLGAAKQVHGSWGSGTLLTTSLLSMLTTHGEVYIGAVKPSVLYAAAEAAQAAGRAAG
jgi:outer membrane lipoprotein-sorting protein